MDFEPDHHICTVFLIFSDRFHARPLCQALREDLFESSRPVVTPFHHHAEGFCLHRLFRIWIRFWRILRWSWRQWRMKFASTTCVATATTCRQRSFCSKTKPPQKNHQTYHSDYPHTKEQARRRHIKSITNKDNYAKKNSYYPLSYF